LTDEKRRRTSARRWVCQDQRIAAVVVVLELVVPLLALEEAVEIGMKAHVQTLAHQVLIQYKTALQR
jgi:hypothetical protein